jgi:hemin uptake protein HemP
MATPERERDAPRAQDADAAQNESKAPGRVVDSGALLRDRGALAIRHRDSIYYLRETRFGKLILTK